MFTGLTATQSLEVSANFLYHHRCRHGLDLAEHVAGLLVAVSRMFSTWRNFELSGDKKRESEIFLLLELQCCLFLRMWCLASTPYFFPSVRGCFCFPNLVPAKPNIAWHLTSLCMAPSSGIFSMPLPVYFPACLGFPWTLFCSRYILMPKNTL